MHHHPEVVLALHRERHRRLELDAARAASIRAVLPEKRRPFRDRRHTSCVSRWHDGRSADP
jgi:hypothetical protein